MVSLEDEDIELRRRLRVLLNPSDIVSQEYGDILERVDVAKSRKWLRAIEEKSVRARYRAGGATLMAMGWDGKGSRWRWGRDRGIAFSQAFETYMGRSLGLTENPFESMDIWLEISDFVMTKSKFYERARETRFGLKGISEHGLPRLFVSDMIPTDLEYYSNKNKGAGFEDTNPGSCDRHAVLDLLDKTKFLYRTPTGPLDWILNQTSGAPWEQWKRLTALHSFMEETVGRELTVEKELEIYRAWGISDQDLRTFFAEHSWIFVSPGQNSLFGTVLRANKTRSLRLANPKARCLVRLRSQPEVPPELKAIADALEEVLEGEFYCNRRREYLYVRLDEIDTTRFSVKRDGRTWVLEPCESAEIEAAFEKAEAGKVS